ncbi:hypothetical protein TNCT_104261 [Trichonephila clavata]|uniref:Uncharacterized protein n=1 Tax=Trichonephila clavata TaxID=2740835 RepID=A0A8X6I1G1_TRICU|nr:hypothetical protein TNCT_104261 [Trichonephila clavata]
MHSISSKYRKPKGRPSKRRAACIRNLEKGKSACSSSSDSKCDEISTGAVPSTSDSENTSEISSQKECESTLSEMNIFFSLFYIYGYTLDFGYASLV